MSVATPLYYFSSLFRMVVQLSVAIALLVVGLGPLRRSRPEASPPIVAAAAIEIGVVLFTSAQNLGAAVLFQALGASQAAAFSSATSVLYALAHAASGLFVVLGLLRTTKD